MYTGNVFGVRRGECEGNQRSEVAALREVPVVAEVVHQLGPGPRDPHQVPPSFGDRAGKAVARDGRNDQMQRVRWVTAVCARICQRCDDVEELGHRSGPTMGEDQRPRPRFG
jgi:hypothetical protein